MKIKHFINYGTIIDKMEGTIHIGPQGSRIQAIEHTAVNQTANEKTHSFRSIVQYPDADELIARLHQLIDGSQGADVGCVLLHCKLHNYLKRTPTLQEFRSEFQLMGTWKSIQKYMNENNLNALGRANSIIVF